MQTIRPSEALPPSEASDARIVDEVNRGNREMFEVIVRRYNTRLYRVGLAYLHHHEQVEDAMQNTYLKAFLKLGGFHQESSVGTWLTRIMINECLMILRRDRSTPVESMPSDLPEPAAPAPQGTLTLKEMKNLLENSIRELPAHLRAVYMLREVEQLSTEEAAASLGVSAGSIKVSLHRARERLKDILLRHAAGIELFPYHAEFCDPMTRRVMQAILRSA